MRSPCGDSSRRTCASSRLVVYAVLAFIFLLWLTLLPTINNLGQVLVVLILVGLAVGGVEILRRQTAREFPNASTSNTNGGN